jgi:hypothetical protein
MIQPILDTLMSPIPPLRIAAAHALGGLVIGIESSKMEFGESILQETAPVVAEFIVGSQKSRNTPSNMNLRLNLSSSPEKENKTIFSPIVTTLKTAIKCTELTSHAQGPYWALCVLASFIVLGGPALHTNPRLIGTVYHLLQCGIKTRKRAIRAMTSTLWGPLLWNWRRWKDELTPDDSSSDEYARDWNRARYTFWKTLQVGAALPTGHAFFASLLGSEEAECSEEDLALLFEEVKNVVKIGGDTTIGMLDMLEKMLTPTTNAVFPPPDTWNRTFTSKLLPNALFSVTPGLLTTDTAASIIQAVEFIMCSIPDIFDVRPLTNVEKRRVGVWKTCKEVWVESLRHLALETDETVPAIFLDLWCWIVKLRFEACEGEFCYYLQCDQMMTRYL